ncbi:lipase family protein [Lactiplantibacillus plantarum]
MVRTVPHILANLEDVVHHEHVSNLLLVGHSLGASYAFLYAQ